MICLNSICGRCCCWRTASVGYEPLIISSAARQRAAEEMPLVFDLPSLEAAVLDGSALLPSTLATLLGGLSRRSDWPARRKEFTRSAQDAHIAEARRRAAARVAVGV